MHANEARIPDIETGRLRSRGAVPALLTFLLPLLTLVACNSVNTDSNLSKKYPFLVGVTLQPGSAPSIPVDGTVGVSANAGYQVSANEIDSNVVTSSATWSTSNVTVATVSKGLVTGTGVGSATISASLDGKTGTTLVVVGQATNLDITSTSPFSLSANPDQQFQASASYSDGSMLDLTYYVSWSSSAPGVLKFYNDYVHDAGEATLLATGTTTVTATLDTGDVASIDVTVVP